MKLKVFLYILLRDHLPFGTIEEILMHHVEKKPAKTPVFSERWVARYAETLVFRLKDGGTKGPKGKAGGKIALQELNAVAELISEDQSCSSCSNCNEHTAHCSACEGMATDIINKLDQVRKEYA